MNREVIEELEGIHRCYFASGKHEGQRMCLSMRVVGGDHESAFLLRLASWRDENEQLGDEYKKRLRARFLAQEKQIEALRAELKQYQHELEVTR